MQNGELKRIGSSWFARYYLDGKRAMKKIASVADYPTEKSVAPKFQEHMANVNKDVDERPAEFRVTNQTTVADFVTEFLKVHADSVRPNTMRGYMTVWDHVRPRLGSKKLANVRTHDIDQMLRDIANANPSMREKTLARIKSFVHLVFAEASRKDLYDRKNPAAEAKVSAKNKTTKKTYAYTDAEAKAIINTVSEPYSVIFAVAHYTGLRRSEILGLKWSDYVDASLHITRSVGFGCDGEMVISNPKTEESQAPVHVVPELTSILKRWKDHQKPVWADCWMFPASDSRRRKEGRKHGDLLDAAQMPPVNPSNILRAILPKLAEKKIRWHGWHAFRRGVATELHRSGVADIVIQRALRHANVAVTQESYIQSVPEVVVDALNRLAKAGKVGTA
jgi:integrase